MLPPTMPTFVKGDYSLANLQALKYGVQFLVDMGTRPTWHFFRNGDHTQAAAAWDTPTYSQTAYDSDGVQSAGTALIVTQGLYAVEGCAQVGSSTTNTLFKVGFQITGGANNPHLALNATQQFGHRGGGTPSSTTGDAAQTSCSVTPIAVYPGDKLDFQVWTTVSLTLRHNNNVSYLQGRFSASFTGYWLKEAT